MLVSLYDLRKKPSLTDVLWTGLPACAAVAICLCFFLPQAFTIDDTIFLHTAKQAILTPTHPFAFDMCWDGHGQMHRFSQFVANAPLMGYLLIPAVLSTSPEISGHVIQLLLLIIALLATASLALRLGLSRQAATIATALTATCPAVLGMTASVMPDILAMALGVVAFERFTAWLQDGTRPSAVLAVFALSLAPLARTQLVLMLPVCALLCLPQVSLPALRTDRRRMISGLLLIACAGFFYFLGARITRDPAAGANVIRDGLIQLSPHVLPYRGVSFGCYLAMTTPFVAGVLVFLARSWRWTAAVILLAAIPFLKFALTGMSFWIMVSVSAVGYVALLWALVQLWKMKTGVSFALALWAVFPLAMVVYLHMAAKYLVPSAPAYALILVMLAPSSGLVSRWSWRILIPAGLVFGMLIVSADNRAANMARQAVEKWLPPMEAKGDRIFFLGQWGFQWYAELDGARCFNPRSSVSASPGDYVVVDVTGSVPFPLKLYPHSHLVDVISDSDSGGVVIDKARNVGFYSDSIGTLPWTWAPQGTLRYELWQIG